MKKLMSLLFIVPAFIGANSFAMQMEKKPTKQEIEQVQDYLADCVEMARLGNFNFPTKGNIQLVLEFNSVWSKRLNRQTSELILLQDDDIILGSVIFSRKKYEARAKWGIWSEQSLVNQGIIDLLFINRDWRNNGIAQYLLFIAGTKLMQEGYTKIVGKAVPQDPEYREDSAMQARLKKWYQKQFGAQEDSSGGLGVQVKELLPASPSEQELERQRRLQEAEQELQKMKAKM